MSDIEATKLVSHTYVGHDTRLLLVEPVAWTPGDTPPCAADYESEAEMVARWLLGTFCNKTLEQVVQKLTPVVVGPDRRRGVKS